MGGQADKQEKGYDDEPAVAVEFPAFITRESVGPGFSRVRPGVDEDGVAGSSVLSVELRKEAPAIGRRQRGDPRGFGYSRQEMKYALHGAISFYSFSCRELSLA